jgi:hypothetical protein
MRFSVATLRQKKAPRHLDVILVLAFVFAGCKEHTILSLCANVLHGDSCCPPEWQATGCRNITESEVELAKTSLESLFAKASSGWDTKPGCHAAYNAVYDWLEISMENTCVHDTTTPSSWGIYNGSVLSIKDYFLDWHPTTEEWLGTILFHEGIHMDNPNMSEPDVDDFQQNYCGIINPPPV